MIGRTLSHYKVLEELSRGGMRIVYHALDLKLGPEIAFKELPKLVTNPDRKQRFVKKAKARPSSNIRVSMSFQFITFVPVPGLTICHGG